MVGKKQKEEQGYFFALYLKHASPSHKLDETTREYLVEIDRLFDLIKEEIVLDISNFVNLPIDFEADKTQKELNKIITRIINGRINGPNPEIFFQEIVKTIYSDLTLSNTISWEKINFNWCEDLENSLFNIQEYILDYDETNMAFEKESQKVFSTLLDNTELNKSKVNANKISNNTINEVLENSKDKKDIELI